jgi:galactokinase
VNIEQLRAEFFATYAGQAEIFSAPGRVNLIGEHTDYNQGFVLPMAIERRTYVAAASNGLSRVRVRSLNVGEAGELDLAVPGIKRRGTWLDYVEGTARALLERGLPVAGADLLVYSDVPAGAGLSASAALELSVGLALATLGGSLAPNRVELALAGQAAEHEYVGTLCGIMDQYIAALGQTDSALLIDCRSLETESVPMRLGEARVLICDTRVKHQLSSSGYNQRREEAASGCQLLAGWLPDVRSLRDVQLEDFERLAPQLPELERRRCRHVVTENARTLAAAQALRAGDLPHLGQLMLESHASLRDDYQVSCEELDVAVEVAAAQSGVYGSRMTGGGFGGCSVSLVEGSAIERVSGAVKAAFAARGWREPELFASKACEGARREPQGGGSLAGP